MEADCERASSWRLSADHRCGESSPLKSDRDHASLNLSHILGYGEQERDEKVSLLVLAAF